MANRGQAGGNRVLITMKAQIIVKNALTHTKSQLTTTDPSPIHPPLPYQPTHQPPHSKDKAHSSKPHHHTTFFSGINVIGFRK